MRLALLGENFCICQRLIIKNVGILSGIILLLRLNVGMLSVTVTANPGQLGNNTGGLLGVVNGNVTDDLTLRNGTIMSTDSTPQEIYEIFGESCKLSIL